MGLSIGLATGLYGVSFGALAVAAGLTVPQASALSALMFTGGSQFAFVGVVAGGGAPSAAMAAASLLGVRNAVYGVQLNALLRPRGWRRWVHAHLAADRTIRDLRHGTPGRRAQRGPPLGGILFVAGPVPPVRPQWACTAAEYLTGRIDDDGPDPLGADVDADVEKAWARSDTWVRASRF